MVNPIAAAAGWRNRLNRLLGHPAAKPMLWLLLAAPALQLLHAAWADTLGANPAEALIRRTGIWALRWLCLTLAITPLRQGLGLPALARFRRNLGVASGIYACIHLLCYAWLDQALDWADIAHDIAKRPFILVGFLAWMLLLPLLATSFNRAIRWLGSARWQTLHKLSYLVPWVALLHFFWHRSAKNRWGEVAVYAVMVLGLLMWRAARQKLKPR